MYVYISSLLYNKFTTGRWVYLIIGEVTASLMEVIIYFAVTAFIMPFMCLLIGHKMCSWFSSMFKLKTLQILFWLFRINKNVLFY